MQSTKRQDTLNRVSKLIRKCILVSAMLLFALTICPLTDAYAETDQLTIVQSSNLNGHLFPCPT